MKNKLILIGIIILWLCSIVIAWNISDWRSGNEQSRAYSSVDIVYDAIKKGNIDAAYTTMSPGYQKRVSETQFKTDLEKITASMGTISSVLRYQSEVDYLVQFQITKDSKPVGGITIWTSKNANGKWQADNISVQ